VKLLGVSLMRSMSGTSDKEAFLDWLSVRGPPSFASGRAWYFMIHFPPLFNHCLMCLIFFCPFANFADALDVVTQQLATFDRPTDHLPPVDECYGNLAFYCPTKHPLGCPRCQKGSKRWRLMYTLSFSRLLISHTRN
jgi:hypothetical protein